MKRTLLTATMGLSLLTATSAFASGGFIRGNVSMYAGPDYGYPSVYALSAGMPVVIEGCVDGWSWCDVVIGDNRGWVPGGYLQEQYGGQLVLVDSYGVQIGIPVVTFVFATYWDNNYRNRPWYGQRQQWSRITPRYGAASARGGSYGNGGSGSRGNARQATYANHAAANGGPARSNVAAAPAARAARVSTPTTHPVRSSTRLASRQAPMTSSTRSQAAPASRAAPPQSHASEPRAAQRTAPAKSAPRKGGDDDKSQH